MEIHTQITRIIAVLFVSVLMLTGTAQAASLYKWTDEEGNVHYSQTPPEHGQADKMHLKDTTPPQNAAPAAAEEPEDQGIPEDAGQDTAEAQARQRNCEIARYNLETYKTSDRLKQPDGTVIVISDEMRDAKMKEAQALIDIYCK